jgi:DNA-binding cell septation regulator SpoVG
LAHPINQEFRDYLQNKVLEAYRQEKTSPQRGGFDKKENETED